MSSKEVQPVKSGAPHTRSHQRSVDPPPSLETHDDIIYPAAIPFVIVHLSCLGILWTGVTIETLILCAVLYLVRMFGVTAGYHRYFSHRTYKTSRVGQFLLAFLAQSSAQRGVIWWAAMHRAHHKASDTLQDVHSPRHRGFWYSHMGWIFSRQDSHCDEELVPDLLKVPELRWLDRNRYMPAALLGIAVFLVWGWTGLFVGFFLSTVLLYHGTFMINSLAHVSGTQRYLTGDDSRNNWILALIAFGEGWHNNHHYYQTSTRQGFRWWEIDCTYYTLCVLSWFHLVWELRSPPRDIVKAQRPLGHGVLERVAQQLMDSISIDTITDRVEEKIFEGRARLELSSEEAKRRLSNLQESISEVVPSFEELRAKARAMFTETPHLDQVVERVRQLLVEQVSSRILSHDELVPVGA